MLPILYACRVEMPSVHIFACYSDYSGEPTPDLLETIAVHAIWLQQVYF